MTSRLTLAASLGLIGLILGAPAARGQAVAARASSRPAQTGARWVVDPVHSQIDFQVRHLVGRVQGTFVDWYGVIVTKDRDWTHGTMNVSAQTASLSTGNAYRDADLRSDRFFAADSFPMLTFESTGIVAHVLLSGQFRGLARDAEGHERIGFDASTRINRRDFGINWTDFVGANTTIGDEVEITIAIEAVRAT